MRTRDLEPQAWVWAGCGCGCSVNHRDRPDPTRRSCLPGPGAQRWEHGHHQTRVQCTNEVPRALPAAGFLLKRQVQCQQEEDCGTSSEARLSLGL